MTTAEEPRKLASTTSRIGRLLVLALVAASIYTAFAVIRIERVELDYRSPVRQLSSSDGTRPSLQLGQVRLHEGDTVTFDVCSDHAFDPAVFLGNVEAAVWQPEAQELLVRTPFDEGRLASARRTVDGTCIEVAQGTLEVAGPYAVEMVWPNRALSPELGRVRPIARVHAYRPLLTRDKAGVFLGFALSLLCLAVVVAHRESIAPRVPPIAVKRIAIGVFAFVLVFAGSEFLPWAGATGALLRGLLIATTEFAVALSAMRGDETVATSERLAFRGVLRNPWLMAPACILLGGALAVLNGVVTSKLVPSTSEAPIEALVSFPSSRLAVGLIALLAPLAEEFFFRGFLFGSLESRMDTKRAWAITVILFALAHVPQTWGAWGSTVSVLATGIVLTTVRARTRSTAASMLTHLAHNALITILSL